MCIYRSDLNLENRLNIAAQTQQQQSASRKDAKVGHMTKINVATTEIHARKNFDILVTERCYDVVLKVLLASRQKAATT